MALLTITTGASFEACRDNIDLMLVDLTSSGLDKESGYRGINAIDLNTKLAAILTALLVPEEVIDLPTGTSFRSNRKFIRQMFVAAYAV